MSNSDLKQYLYDILLIENQIHTYHNIEHIYIKKIGKIEEDKNTVFLNDKEDYKRRKFHRTSQTVPAPDEKPNYIGEEKIGHGKKKFIYGFHGIQEMYYKVPERWLEGELGSLKQHEHNKYRKKRLLAWIILSLIGITIAIIIKNFIPFLISIIVALLFTFNIEDENKRDYLPGDDFYDLFMKIYTKEYDADLKKKEELLEPEIQHFTQEYEIYVKKTLHQLENTLHALYAKNIVHPKYQNLIAIAQLYDYINIGRCNELNGADGAYNLYEKEKNEGILLNDLDLALFKLDKYNSTMFTLIQLLKQDDVIISKIHADVEQKSNIVLKQFVNQCKQQHTEICQHY